MNIDDVLARFEGVQRHGDGSHGLARCPTARHEHGDRRPSLSFRVRADGIGLHCFAGCETVDVLAAVGLRFADLFPEERVHRSEYRRGEHWHAKNEAWRVIESELFVAVVEIERAAHDGVPLTGEARDRLRVAAGRLRAAAEVLSS